ncbi:MAG TPA: agmatinase [Epulopiscium sp.]|nr:agmatinase [Candidatus Epulonipiscium sp.]
MNKNKNITTFIGCNSDYNEAEIVVFGAPYDGTTSNRPGTRFAPSFMRLESYALETYSPYLDKDMEDYTIFDGGDLEFPFGNTHKTLNVIYENTMEILKDKKKPFMIGGEHLVTLGSFQALYKHNPDICVIHLDAHTDLREEYLGERFSHATVMKRIHDFVGDGRIFQYGIRSGTKEEFQWAKEHISLTPFTLDGIEEATTEIGNRPVYVTIDLDVLDPSIFSGTGTIEPGGVTFKELLIALNKIKKMNIVGADIVELSPHNDATGTSTAVACKVMRELLLTMVK